MKLSANKRSYPGRKQVWRVYERGESGMAVHDVIGASDESRPAGEEALLRCVHASWSPRTAGDPGSRRCRQVLEWRFPDCPLR